MYNGGSDRDSFIDSGSGTFPLSQIWSTSNQVFIIFTTDGNRLGKGFTAKITFGIKLYNY